MKKLAVLLITMGTLVFGAFGQGNTSTRPRVAPTAAPPRILNAPPVTTEDAGPPVLINGNKPTANPTATPPEDDEVIRVETNLVTMPVSVLDRDGRFISGLQQKDFKIFEDGVEQKLDYFQSVEQPFTVILLIDVSPSTQFRIDEIQSAAITFVDQLRPADKVMVVAFDQHVQVMCPATNDRRVLRGAIQQAQFGDGTSLYEAVDYVIQQQLRTIQGRKAVVLFSDGVDTTSRRASYDSTLKDTEEVDALFYTIRYDTSTDMYGGNNNPTPRTGRGGRVTMADILGAILTGGNVSVGSGGRGRGGANSAEYEKGRKYLETLALNSGGRQFEAQSIYNVDAAFAGIAEELRRQYSLGYYPEAVGKVGDRKQIKIRVMRPNVVVRAKNSYVVGKSDRNVAGR
ncbi:MAG TPA: VWA domain-containing protein [Pyrinomonadaceae bacterium]|nr:VWA domain-containing protein [Pyrinomonadaceae bacterium]